MPETVDLIRVFVSSPGDVAAEREALEEVVRQINRLEGRAQSLTLQTFRWEKDVVPQVGPPPQEVVGKQTPSCDIYLGILSTRFGTPTEKFGSGTEQEFRQALAAWEDKGHPWIMFYFDDTPPGKLDLKQLRQYVKVREFREELEGKGIIGIYTGGANGFALKADYYLRKALKMIVEPPTASTEVPASYLEWLIEHCSDLDLRGLEVEPGGPAQLQSLYVPLTTPVAESGEEAASRVKVTVLRGKEPTFLLDLLDQHSLYVSGDPGSGKSTFCRWVAWLCSSGRLPLQDDVPDGYQEPFPQTVQGRLPLLIRLRDFWTALPDTPGTKWLSARGTEKALRRWIEDNRPGELGWLLVEAHLKQGSALILLDGMDEVPLTWGESEDAAQPRSMLLSGLSEAIPAWIQAGNRVLLTSRPYGMTTAQASRMNLRASLIGDLPGPLQRLLAKRWFRILMNDSGKAEAQSEEMFSHVQQRKGLSDLFAKPMMLTATCAIFHQEKRLPQDLYDFYSRIVNNILYNRIEAKTQIDKIRNRLMVVAYGMHRGSEGLGEKRTTPQAETTVDEIDRMLRDYRHDNSEHTMVVRDSLLSNTGLLLPREGDKAAFYHLSFQEFLAALMILQLKVKPRSEVFVQRASRPEWRTTLSMAFASLGARFSSCLSVDLLEILVRYAEPKAESVGLLQVAADCLEILNARHIALKKELKEKFEQDCCTVIEKEISPLDSRHQLALTLGRVGDPRIVADLREKTGYLEVPAGEYRLGKEDELRELRIGSPFLLSRYPVTNSQFELFIREGGYRELRFWSATGRQWIEKAGPREPDLWREQAGNGPNQPVVGVCYWEADAFANWAGGRLPTEREWEAAARGLEGREYPWGGQWDDGICNSRESKLGGTSAVGLFRGSRSPDGLEDMAGNVDEWCAVEPGEEGEEEQRAIDVDRPVRGGSWLDSRDFARPAFRNAVFANNRVSDVGFRVLLCSGSRTRSG